MSAFPAFDYTVLERFLRYVVIDTQSDPESPSTPSTEKQKKLGRLLVIEDALRACVANWPTGNPTAGRPS